jgi:trans-aconitate 2-methyltransferase
VSSDWDASTYDRVSDPQFRWASVVVERLEPGAGTILDAGCGSGRVTQLLLERFPQAHVIGIDASETMIAEARRRLEPFGERVRLAQGDLTRPLPVAEPVDAIFSNAVFHWIDDHDVLFSNLASALRSGGQLVAQWGGRGNISRLADVVNELGVEMSKNFATAGETLSRLEKAGFVDVRTWLHEAPADFDTRESFEEYLRTVCIRCQLDLLPQSERDAFVRAVADGLPDRRIDYVRLNALARRG